MAILIASCSSSTDEVERGPNMDDGAGTGGQATGGASGSGAAGGGPTAGGGDTSSSGGSDSSDGGAGVVGGAGGTAPVEDVEPLPAFCTPCEAYVGAPAGEADEACEPAQKNFELGTEGAFKIFDGIVSRSFTACGDQVYCGKAALMLCADFNEDIPAKPNGWKPDSTNVGDVVINVTPPPPMDSPPPKVAAHNSGWIGKSLSLAFYLEGPELKAPIDVRMQLGKKPIDSKRVSGSDDVGVWIVLSDMVTTKDLEDVEDVLGRVALTFRGLNGVAWQGKVYVDHLTW